MISVGLDAGGTYVKAVVVDGDRVVARTLHPLPDCGLIELLARVASEAAEPDRVGVGIAGLVEWPAGYFVWGPHIAEKGLAIAGSLEATLGVPVVVDNDANAAAYAELTNGAAQGAATALVLTLGTGIGGGLIIDGRVVRGSSFAGEVGHITLVAGGSECACGRWGCWETLVSGAALDRKARELDAGDASALVRAARKGHRPSVDALAEMGRYLGEGIVQLSLILDPAVVVIGGGASEAGELLTAPAVEAIASSTALAGRVDRPRVVTAHHGGWAGAVGAAYLARDLDQGDR